LDAKRTSTDGRALPGRITIGRTRNQNSAPCLIIALTSAFSTIGGIQSFNRLLCSAAGRHADRRDGRIFILALNDQPDALEEGVIEGNVTFRGFSGNKVAFSLSLLRHTLRQQPSTLIFGHVNLAPVALLAGIFSGCDQTFVIHGIEAWIPLARTRRMALSRATRVLAVSDFTRQETARLNGLDVTKFVVFPNALDPQWIAQQSTDNKPPVRQGEILTVTRLAGISRGKGVDWVMRALPAVRKCVPDAHYTIVGDGPDRERLEEICRELNLEDHVSFEGRASSEDLTRIYQRCHVFAMPSQNEGFGVVFLEAGFFEKPSVGGDYAGAREAIIDGVTGFLVPQDAGLIADRLIRLLQSPDDADAMGRRAKEHVEKHYLYTALADRFDAIFDGDTADPA